MTTKQDIVNTSLNIVFKMCAEDRMDEEEAKILLDVIFSGQMDEELFSILRFIYKVRPAGDSRLTDDGCDKENSAKHQSIPQIDIEKEPKEGISIEISFEGFDLNEE